jgi:hypothetical protein
MMNLKVRLRLRVGGLSQAEPAAQPKKDAAAAAAAAAALVDTAGTDSVRVRPHINDRGPGLRE